jgi:hypothetical protein
MTVREARNAARELKTDAKGDDLEHFTKLLNATEEFDLIELEEILGEIDETTGL